MAEEGAIPHLGLDVGATNLKVTLVEHRAGTRTAVSRDQVPTGSSPTRRAFPTPSSGLLEVAEEAADVADDEDVEGPAGSGADHHLARGGTSGAGPTRGTRET